MAYLSKHTQAYKMSFRQAREELLYALDEDLISEDEFILLYDFKKSRSALHTP